jgi:hypothetical protein
MRAANWAKAGQIAGWDAYLAAENDNTYCAWYDATGATDKAKGASGGVLEGTLDLMGEFGFIPSQLYLAVGVYPTADGAALLSNYQLPNSLDNDGNIQAAEYILIQLAKGWTNQGGGSWSGMANWADGIIPGGALSGPGAHADLLGAITAPSTITLNSAVTIGQLTFDNTNSYTLGGPGSIVMDVASGSASTSFNDNTTATVASGADLILQSPIVLANGSTLTTTGGGTVEIASTVSNSAGSGFHVTGGTLKTSSDLNEAIVQIDAGTVAFDATQHLASLSIASGAKAYLSNGAGVRAIKTASLSITGQLEIGANGVIVDWTGASTLTSVRDAIANGKLTSLDAAADPVHRAIGYAEASAIGSPASFLSESIDGTSILIRYTVMGDANLDGRVNALDFNALATDFGRSEQFWFTGDFSDDGLVTTADFNALAGNFNGLLPSPTAALGAAVPEPCGCSLVILLLGSVTPRPFRWRRNGG